MLRTSLSMLRHLAAPPRCEACGSDVPASPALCHECRSRLHILTGSHCLICAMPFEGETLSEHRCQDCLTRSPDFNKVNAAFEFEGTAAALLHGAKFGRHLTALKLLAGFSKTKFKETLEEFLPDYLVPVPLSWRRSFVRGFNQSYLIARYLRDAVGSNAPIFDRVRRCHLDAQARHGLRQRLRRLDGAFTVSSEDVIQGSRILVIDDVLTTGATAGALSAALKSKGAGEVEIFVLARVRRRYD